MPARRCQGRPEPRRPFGVFSCARASAEMNRQVRLLEWPSIALLGRSFLGKPNPTISVSQRGNKLIPAGWAVGSSRDGLAECADRSTDLRAVVVERDLRSAVIAGHLAVARTWLAEASDHPVPRIWLAEASDHPVPRIWLAARDDHPGPRIWLAAQVAPAGPRFGWEQPVDRPVPDFFVATSGGARAAARPAPRYGFLRRVCRSRFHPTSRGNPGA